MNTKEAKQMTENMSRASAAVLDEAARRPRKGDRFHCDACGMELQVTADCRCPDDAAHFHCCGHEMRKR